MHEAIAQIFETRTAAGPGAAALANFLDRARAIIDDCVEVAFRSRVTDADQHLFRL